MNSHEVIKYLINYKLLSQTNMVLCAILTVTNTLNRQLHQHVEFELL